MLVWTLFKTCNPIGRNLRPKFDIHLIFITKIKLVNFVFRLLRSKLAFTVCFHIDAVTIYGGVAQFVGEPNSNRKVASVIPTLGISRCCILF